MADYKLSEETLNGVLQYLGTRPYGEVSSHVQAIQQATLITEEAKEAHEKVKEDNEESNS